MSVPTGGYVILMISLLALAVSIWSAITAAGQRRVAANKLRLDLFEMRFRIYNLTRQILSDSISGDRVGPRELLIYAWETADVQFLFGQDVVAYVDQVFNRLNTMHAANAMLDSLFTGAAQQEQARVDLQESTDWVTSQRDELVRVMAPYLQFGDVRQGTGLRPTSA
jgi:hypothetical protein